MLIGMCEKGGQWEQACVFLHDMQAQGLTPSESAIKYLTMDGTVNPLANGVGGWWDAEDNAWGPAADEEQGWS